MADLPLPRVADGSGRPEVGHRLDAGGNRIRRVYAWFPRFDLTRLLTETMNVAPSSPAHVSGSLCPKTKGPVWQQSEGAGPYPAAGG